MLAYVRFTKILRHSLFVSLVSILFVTAAYAAPPPACKVVGFSMGGLPFARLHIRSYHSGFDIDLIRAIARQSKTCLHFKQMPFQQLFAALQAGKIDIAASSITITTKRLRDMHFTNSYFRSGLSILVPQNSQVANLTDLKNKKIATKMGTTSEHLLTQQGYGKNLVLFKRIRQAYHALQTKHADAVIFDNPMNAYYIEQHSNYKVVGPLLTHEYYGFAVRKNETQLLQALNIGLRKVQQNGTYTKIYQRYFGKNKQGVVVQVMSPQQVQVDE